MPELSDWMKSKTQETRYTRMTPRRLELPDYMGVVIQADPTRVRRVPSTAVTEQGDDEFGAFAFVACSCEHHPVAREQLSKCPGCERWYVLERGVVWVVYGAMTPPLVPVHNLDQQRDDADEGDQDRDHHPDDDLGGAGPA